MHELRGHRVMYAANRGHVCTGAEHQSCSLSVWLAVSSNRVSICLDRTQSVSPDKFDLFAIAIKHDHRFLLFATSII